MFEMMKKLMETDGISGDESEVRDLIMKEIRKHVDEVTVDSIGNLIAHKKGDAPRVMLTAHMDEIGLMVKGIDSDGSIIFSRIGGIESLTLIGQRVRIKVGKEPIYGVITTAEISNGDMTDSMPRSLDMYIDTGLSKEELIKKDVRVGSFISLQQEIGMLADNNVVYGRALDDRIGCYVLMELAKLSKKTESDTYYVFTVQEEIGLYGAKTSTYKIKPDLAVAVDATNAEDKGVKIQSNILGKGPCITLKDSGMITNRCMNDWLTDIAKQKNIPIQYDVGDKGTTDALSISLSREGVPATVVGIAVRNIHSTIGMASMKDVENAIKLLEEFIKNPPKVCIT